MGLLLEPSRVLENDKDLVFPVKEHGPFIKLFNDLRKERNSKNSLLGTLTLPEPLIAAENSRDMLSVWQLFAMAPQLKEDLFTFREFCIADINAFKNIFDGNSDMAMFETIPEAAIAPPQESPVDSLFRRMLCRGPRARKQLYKIVNDSGTMSTLQNIIHIISDPGRPSLWAASYTGLSNIPSNAQRWAICKDLLQRLHNDATESMKEQLESLLFLFGLLVGAMQLAPHPVDFMIYVPVLVMDLARIVDAEAQASSEVLQRAALLGDLMYVTAISSVVSTDFTAWFRDITVPNLHTWCFHRVQNGTCSMARISCISRSGTNAGMLDPTLLPSNAPNGTNSMRQSWCLYVKSKSPSLFALYAIFPTALARRFWVIAECLASLRAVKRKVTLRTAEILAALGHLSHRGDKLGNNKPELVADLGCLLARMCRTTGRTFTALPRIRPLRSTAPQISSYFEPKGPMPTPERVLDLHRQLTTLKSRIDDLADENARLNKDLDTPSIRIDNFTPSATAAKKVIKELNELKTRLENDNDLKRVLIDALQQASDRSGAQAQADSQEDMLIDID